MNNFAKYYIKAKRMDTDFGENNNWISGLLTVMWGAGHVVDPDEENVAYPVDMNTVCRNTGQKDKMGRPIWENDVIQSPEGTCYQVIYYEPFACFMLTRTNGDGSLTGRQLHLSECKVVGNMFDGYHY